MDTSSRARSSTSRTRRSARASSAGWAGGQGPRGCAGSAERLRQPSATVLPQHRRRRGSRAEGAGLVPERRRGLSEAAARTSGANTADCDRAGAAGGQPRRWRVRSIENLEAGVGERALSLGVARIHQTDPRSAALPQLSAVAAVSDRWPVPAPGVSRMARRSSNDAVASPRGTRSSVRGEDQSSRERGPVPPPCARPSAERHPAQAGILSRIYA